MDSSPSTDLVALAKRAAQDRFARGIVSGRFYAMSDGSTKATHSAPWRWLKGREIVMNAALWAENVASADALTRALLASAAVVVVRGSEHRASLPGFGYEAGDHDRRKAVVEVVEAALAMAGGLSTDR